MSFIRALDLQNVDLLLVGITIAAIGILGFIIFLNNRTSVTSKTFFLFSILTIAYGTFNYLSYQAGPSYLILWFIRLTLFFAVWHAFSFFQLSYVFPKEQATFPKKYKVILVPLVALTAILTLTPLVFSGIEGMTTLGEIGKPLPGLAIPLFGIMVFGLVLGGMFLLIKKTVAATGSAKNQFQFVTIGAFITFTFIIAFNFILPVVFKNATLVPLASIFFLPFILFTAYSIVKYGFLNIKILATSVLTFILAIVMLFEVLLARDLGVLVFRVSIFLLVLSFGILLIRSVRREVEQRVQLEDLTKRLERANKELKRLDAAKSEFISIASHQLRTPLTAVKGYISLVVEGSYGKLPEKMKRPIRNVYDSNERLIRLVNDLLSISRIESGRMQMDFEQTNLQDIIESVIQELNIKAREKNIELIFQKPENPLPEMRLDNEKIRNVILNIIDNGIKYTEKGSITISVSLQPKQNPKNVLLEFKDTGDGMRKEELKRLFQSFTRGSAGVKRFAEGAGLGLYIAKQFVEMHNGTIRAESEGKGKGSSFLIQLPLK